VDAQHRLELLDDESLAALERAVADDDGAPRTEGAPPQRLQPLLRAAGGFDGGRTLLFPGTPTARGDLGVEQLAAHRVAQHPRLVSPHVVEDSRLSR